MLTNVQRGDSSSFEKRKVLTGYQKLTMNSWGSIMETDLITKEGVKELNVEYSVIFKTNWRSEQALSVHQNV